MVEKRRLRDKSGLDSSGMVIPSRDVVEASEEKLAEICPDGQVVYLDIAAYKNFSGGLRFEHLDEGSTPTTKGLFITEKFEGEGDDKRIIGVILINNRDGSMTVKPEKWGEYKPRTGESKKPGVWESEKEKKDWHSSI